MTTDIILSIIILLFFLNGIQKGMVYMVFSIAKIFLAILLSPNLKEYVHYYIKDFNLFLSSDVLAYIIAFLIIIIVISIIQEIINQFMKLTGLKIFDRIIGALLGIAEAFIVIIIITTAMIYLKDYSKVIETELYKSKIIYYTSIYTKNINEIFPDVLEKKLSDFHLENIKKHLIDNIYKKFEKDE